jgi:CRISPR-associated protein Cas1
MLANLYLDDLDEALEKEGFRLVRFADDFVVLCKRRERADVALELTEEILEDLDLRLNKEKTRVVSFDEGFRFLGSLFVRSLIVPAKHPAKNTDAVPLDTSAPPAEVINFQEPSVSTGSAPSTGAAPPESPALPNRHDLEETALGRAFLRALDTEGVSIAEFVARMTAQAPAEPPPFDVATTSEEAIPAPESTPSTESTESTVSTGTTPPGATAFRRTLYIQEQGSWLRINAGRFRVTDGKARHATLLDVPAIKVDQIVVFGHCLLTPAVLQYCLRNEIPITLLSSQGQYFGQIDATTASQVGRQRLQFLHHLDAPARLALARRIVDAKLYNLRSMLRRYARRLGEAALSDAAGRIAQIQRRLAGAETLDQVRGFEGSGSAAYFAVFGKLLGESGFTFEGRNRQPPRDPVNAMLSFGYTLLFYNIYAMLRVHRLNPYVGMLHEEQAGHPALASDMIEEFRFVIDRMVIALCNKKRVKPADFYFGAPAGEGKPAGCFLTDEARKTFIGAFERTMHRPLARPGEARPVSVRQAIDLQVRAYAAHLEGKTPYRPYVLVK